MILGLALIALAALLAWAVWLYTVLDRVARDLDELHRDLARLRLTTRTASMRFGARVFDGYSLFTDSHGTVFQWLIERGQAEGQTPTVWLENSARHPASDRHWTTEALDAAMFPTREAAEDYIYEHLTHPTRGASARAVEHGFMTEARA